MTKTYTEQWREGTLAGGDYYIKTTGLGIDKIIINYYEEELRQFDGLCDCSVAEVLAPVPSYDKVKEMSQKIERLEFDNEALEMAYNEGKEINAELVSKNEQLEKKLAIAIKALSDIEDGYSEATGAGQTVRQALKEMEGVK